MNDVLTQKLLIIEQCKLLDRRGYLFSSSGNISIKLNDGTLLISPTNSLLSELTVDTISHIDHNDTLLSGLPPSKELAVHRALYQNTSINAIVHLHSHYCTSLSCLKNINTENFRE